MTKSTIQDEQMKLHIKNENRVLRELQKIYVKHSYSRTCNLDSSTDNLVETKGGSYSPDVEDLLMEMNRKELKEFDETNNTNCYRCRHFLIIPQNLFKTSEEISSCTKEYEDSLTFVQAVIWLKSAIKFMKDISIEQFHLAFHKQWNNREKGKGSECCNRNSSLEIQGRNNESINLSTALNVSPENITSVSDSEDTSSISVLRYVNNKKRKISRNDCEQQMKGCNEDFVRRNSRLSICGTQSPERYFNNSRRNDTTLNNCVIADSGSEYSSSSDIFRDSIGSQETDNALRNEENNKSFEESVGVFTLTSQCTDFSQKSFSGAKNDVSVNSNGDDSSDITMFDEDCSVQRRRVADLQNDEYKRSSGLKTRTECIQTSDYNFTNKVSSVSTNQIDSAGSPLKDSAYDTNPLSAEHFIYQNEDVDIFPSQRIDFIITPYQKDDSASDTDSLKILSIPTTVRDGASDGDRQSYLSPSKLSLNNENDETASSIDTEFSVYENAAASQRNGSLENDESLIESTKHKVAHGVDCISVENVKEERKISSQLLSFTLDALNVDDIAFRSVKVILAIFQDERMVKQYMRKRYWEGTLELQAVNAVLDFRDVFEAENKTDVCTHEILQTVTSTLDRCIENTELSKTTILTHQVSIILELCRSMPVCIGTLNYLTAKLKSQENVLTSVMNNKKADMHNIINQLHITFYALSLCLQKYRLVFPNMKDYQFEEEIIPSVIDLWKKQSKLEGVMLEDSVHMREQRWFVILNNFAVVAIDNFPQFAEKSRRLSNILTRE